MEQEDAENVMVSMATLPDVSLGESVIASSTSATTATTVIDSATTAAAPTAVAPAKGPDDKSAKPPAPVKIVDMSQPIKLTSETLVSVGGKQCVLRVDPDTSHLVAYPVRSDSTGE